MLPLFFGPSDRALYGVYDPAPPGARRGLVICQPFGAEYFNAHRASRALARQLADAGVHTLRFDYSGTGDSAGEIDDIGPDDWLEDIAFAMDELRDMAGIRLVGLVGLRMGAALALATALRDPDVDRLVLWDPVSAAGPSDGAPEHLPECESVLVDSTGTPPKHTLLICTGDLSLPLPAVADSLRARCEGLATVREDERGAWESDGGIGSLPPPVRSVQAIVDWCVRES